MIYGRNEGHRPLFILRVASPRSSGDFFIRISCDSLFVPHKAASFCSLCSTRLGISSSRALSSAVWNCFPQGRSDSWVELASMSYFDYSQTLLDVSLIITPLLEAVLVLLGAFGLLHCR